MKILIYFILIAVCIYFIRKFTAKFKFPKIGSLALVTGGVKCGKSTFAVGLAIAEHKRAVRRTKFKNFFRKLFGKEPFALPLLYSNIPLGVPYVQLTKDLILRKKRFEYGSIIYVSEASLLADSQLVHEKTLNDRLLLFNKLIGHETLGGKLIMDSQQIADLHYSTKRCLSEYIYIHSLTKWIPFFLVANVIENRYSEDNSIIAVDTDDIELKTRKVIMRKKVWKYFDAFCYSSFTDNLPVENNVLPPAKDFKAYDIISFRDNPLLHTNKEVKKNEKKNN